MQFLKFSVFFSGDVFLTPYQKLMGKYRKVHQQQQQAQQAIDNQPDNQKALARKNFLEALDYWRTADDVALGLSMLYEQEQEAQKATDPKNISQDKDISVSLILGKGCNTRIDGVEYEYPPHLRRIASILVCLPVSSANVERIFSHLKLLYSKRRLRLNPETVKELMFLGQNKCVPTYTLKDFKK